MKSFVIAYERSRGKVLDFREYSESDHSRALRERFELELQYREHRDIEVVILGADSIDVLKKTHARYFMGPAELLRQAIAELS